MNSRLFTFDDGTFAGQTIRVTVDGFASIYDIMRVAGVGDITYWTASGVGK